MLINIYLKSIGTDVKAIYDNENETVLVLKGSKIRNEIVDSYPLHRKKLRDKIITDNTIIQDYKFLKDYEFNSLSAAASICMGRNANGLEEFKTEDNKEIGKQINIVPDFINYILSNIDLKTEALEKANNERKEFLDRYPLEHIKDMTLKEYDEVGNPYSFMNMIERRTSGLGSGHLSGNKNKIFYQSKKDMKYGTIEFIKSLSDNQNLSIEQQFSRYINEIYNFIVSFNAEEYNSRMDYPGKEFLQKSNIIKIKLITLYKGPIITTLNSLYMIRKMVDFLNIPYLDYEDSLDLNIKLTKYIFEKEPKLKKYSLYQISTVIWEYYHMFVETEKRYYAVGFTIDDEDKKQQFFDNGIVALGWKELGSLIDYDSEDQLKEQFSTIYPDGNCSYFLSIYRLLKGLRKGDTLVLKSSYVRNTEGKNKIYAIGKLLYDFDEGYNFNPEIGNCLPVEWNILENAKELPGGGYRNALCEIKDRNFKRAIKEIMLEKNELSTNEEDKVIGENLLYYGVPGCGKSYLVNKKTKDKYDIVERILFYPDYTYNDFVGQIIPQITEDNKILYKFEPGPLTKILCESLKNPNSNYVLIIEEINRGNAPSIFGDIFQLLDRDINGESEYKIRNEMISQYLKEKDIDEYEEIYIPNNLSIIATMNSNDQNVFVLDTAFKRRWKFIRVSNEFTEEHPYYNMKIDGTNTTWEEFVRKINEKISSLNEYGINGDDKQIGKFFVRKSELNDKKAFAEKVLLYLWEDVVKFNKSLLFKEEYNSLDNLIDDFSNYGLKVFNGIFDEEVEENV